MSATRIAVLGSGDATPILDDTTVPVPLQVSGIDTTLLPVPGASFPLTPNDRLKCEQAYLAAGIEAADSGADAVYINTVGDYGLSALNQVLSIPAMGAGSGALQYALTSASSFSIVTLWPPAMRFIYDAMLADSKLTQYCDEIVHLSDDTLLATSSGPLEAMATAQACGITTLDKITAAIQRVNARHPDSAVVLGCTCMYPIAPRLQERDLSVIEPMGAGYRQLADATRH
jgi:allantoin racemase